MEFLKKEPKIPFMRLRFLAIGVSLILIVFSVYEWVSTGESKYGLDFVGGSELVIEFEEPTDIREVRGVLEKTGLSDVTVQDFDPTALDQGAKSQFSVRASVSGDSDATQIVKQALGTMPGKTFSLLQENYVGPIIGAQIRKDGLTAIILSLIGILIYVSFRFEARFALGGVVALAHDVIITGGFYILSGRQLNAAALAAFLTVIGYSINDTIVIFDRVRENIDKAIKKAGGKKEAASGINLHAIIDSSVNQTLSRSIITSLTVVFVAVPLWLLAGGVVADLAFAMLIGLLVGVYSSVFVACPIVAMIPSRK